MTWIQTIPEGEATGVLKEDALGTMWDSVWPTPQRLAVNFQQVARRALSLGITSVHDVVGEGEIRAYQIVRASGTLPVRAYLMARDHLLPHLAVKAPGAVADPITALQEL